MPDARFTLLPEERFAPLRGAVLARVRDAAQQVCGRAFGAVFDPGYERLLRNAFTTIGAHEGTVWLVDDAREHLVPRWNSGPQAAQFVDLLRQPLAKGMISMVVATQQPICENEVYRNARQDKTADQTLGVLTCAMLAVPLAFGEELRGVLTAVQIKPAGTVDPDPPGFTAEHLVQFQHTAGVLGRLLDLRLLHLALGLSD
jgi:transcriptional regulator with GAF, ATPase, and Fis domain